jgi:hypothetical protein
MPDLLSNIASTASSVFAGVDLAQDFSEMQICDTYDIPESNIATFECKNKGIRVSGLIAEAWQFSVDSKWDNKALGSIADSSLLRLGDTLAQDLIGQSLNQPILNRRSWGGTSPFGTSVKLRFIATSSGKTDVYIPVLKLLALLYPRLIGTGDEHTILGMFAMPGPAPFGNLAQALKDGLGSKLLDASDSGGDPVSVTVGSLIKIDAAYLTKVQGSFSKALDFDGYPLAAEVFVSFESMDTPFFVRPTTFTPGDYTVTTVNEGLNNAMRAADNSNNVAQAMETLLDSIPEEGKKVLAAGIDAVVTGINWVTGKKTPGIAQPPTQTGASEGDTVAAQKLLTTHKGTP